MERAAIPAGPAASRRFRWRGNWGVISIALGSVLWEVGGQLAQFTFFPPLSVVVPRLFELLADGEVLSFGASSLLNLAVGFGISLVVGIGLGVLMGAYRRVDMALEFYVRALLTAPSLVFAPIFFSLFGLSRVTIFALIVLYTMPIVILTTSSAVKAVPRALVEMGRTYGAGDLYIFRRILVPGATPLIMAGVRLGAARAVKGMINGEMFIGVIGLGGMLVRAGRAFDSATILAILLLLIALTFGLVWLIQVIDRRTTRWVPEVARH